MLKHQSNENLADTTTISPREFAEAVAHIENSRSDLHDQHIEVEDAIQQLGIDVRPEEVLVLVRARRAEQERAVQRARELKRKVVQTSVGVVLCLSLAANFLLLRSMRLRSELPVETTTSWLSPAGSAETISAESPAVADVAAPTLAPVTEATSATTPSATRFQSGEFRSMAGKRGTVYFASPYRLTPNVELPGLSDMAKIRIVETTPNSFTWECNCEDNSWNSAGVHWRAEGQQ